MKSTALTTIKLLLIAIIIILFAILITPTRIKLKEIRPSAKPGTTRTQSSESAEESLPLEKEDMVALLFGWSRPRVTPRPASTAKPVPNIPLEMWIVAVRNAKIIGADGITRYYCKKLNIQSGFWISYEETNAEGWRLLEILPNTGYLVLHDGVKKILRFER